MSSVCRTFTEAHRSNPPGSRLKWNRLSVKLHISQAAHKWRRNREPVCLCCPWMKKKRKGIFTYTLTNTLSVFFVLKHVLLHRLKTGWWIYLRCEACPVVSVRWVYGAQLSVQTWSPPLILRLQAVWTLEDDNTRIWHFKVVVCWAVCVTLSEWDFIPVTTWNFPSQRFPRGVTETLTAPLPSLTLTPTWEKITPLLLYYFHYSYLKSGITVFFTL